MRNKMQEINKKAAMKASEALSKLIDRPVNVTIPGAEVKKVQELSPVIDSEDIVAGIHMSVTGDLTGAALLIFPKETAFTLCDLLVKRKPGTTRKLSKLDKSALKEVGNILSGNYLAVMSNTLKIKLIEHVPDFSFDMFGAIVSQIISKFAQEAEKTLIIEIEFAFKPIKIKGYLFLLFMMKDIDAILESPTVAD